MQFKLRFTTSNHSHPQHIHNNRRLSECIHTKFFVGLFSAEDNSIEEVNVLAMWSSIVQL